MDNKKQKSTIINEYQRESTKEHEWKIKSEIVCSFMAQYLDISTTFFNANTLKDIPSKTSHHSSDISQQHFQHNLATHPDREKM